MVLDIIHGEKCFLLMGNRVVFRKGFYRDYWEKVTINHGNFHQVINTVINFDAGRLLPQARKHSLLQLHSQQPIILPSMKEHRKTKSIPGLSSHSQFLH